MTTETTTPPLCRHCGKPRRPRANQPGYTGAHGYCEGCYARWLKAGRPAEGPPPPMTSSESHALAGSGPRRTRESASRELSLAAVRSWYRDAGCDGMDTGLFFPVGVITDEVAKATCARCPVRRRCLDFAIATSQKGIWGGLTDDERAAERRRRARRAAAEEMVA